MIRFRFCSLLIFLVVIAILFIEQAGASFEKRNNDRDAFFKRSTVNLFNLCRRTDYPAVCMGAAKPMQRSRAVGPANLAQSLIKAALLKTTAARARASALLGSGEEKGIARGNLQVCKQVYDDAINDLKSSLENLAKGDLPGLKINLSAALSDISTCDDAYAETSGNESPLVQMNSNLNKLASNSLAVADELRF